MIGRVLLDTGPLLALINKRDQHHAWAVARFADMKPPLLTCESVLAEACHLTDRLRGGKQGVLELIQRGAVELAFALKEHFTPVSSLMRRYANVPMSLADACLVRMSELVADAVVFTLDSDFRIYRRHSRQSIPLLIPPHG
jgi:predicted nucleic acid-binding protein